MRRNYHNYKKIKEGSETDENEQWFVTHWSDNGRMFRAFNKVDQNDSINRTQLGLPFVYVKAKDEQEALGKLINRILDVFQEHPEAFKEIGFVQRRVAYELRESWFDLLKLGNKNDIRLGSIFS